MTLPVILLERCVDFSIRVPNIHDSRGRLLFLYFLGLPDFITRRIPLDGSTIIFCQELIYVLAEYGKQPDGKDYLLTYLNQLKVNQNYFGAEEKVELRKLIQDIEKYQKEQDGRISTVNTSSLEVNEDTRIKDNGITIFTTEGQEKPNRVVVRLSLKIDREFNNFSVADKEILFFVISRLCNVSSEDIKLIRISEGSVLVVIEMPENAAQTLLKIYLNDDPALISQRILEIKIQPQNIDAINKIPPIKKKDIANIKGKIDFGIITIREDEFSTVLDRFSPEIHTVGNRRYAISRVQITPEKTSTVAIVRSIEQGEGNAQDVTRDMIQDLDPKWILLVGIAGAVPSVDYTLGDVVLASRLYDFSVIADIEGRSQEYASMGGPMHKKTQDILASMVAFKKELQDWNSVTSVGMDKPPVKITEKNLYGDEEWKENVKSSLNFHFKYTEHIERPRFVVGNIASSDRLIKNTKTVQEWKKFARGINGIEMELGGVYLAARRIDKEYPIIAIRGISDIVGFKRDPLWTKYACNSAAAFTYALVKSGIIDV